MNRPTADVLAGIERFHAIPSRKPNEYNSASDVHGVTWHYAGAFRAAHAAGWNDASWGHLAVLGLDTPTEHQAEGLVRGIRRARTQLVARGWLTRDHRVVAHSSLGSTGCPGPLRTDGRIWSQIVAPLPSTPPPPSTEESPDMLFIEWRPSTQSYTGFMWDGISLAHAANGHATAVALRAGVRRQVVTDAELDGIIQSSRTTTAPPETLTAVLRRAWVESAA